MAEGIDAAAHTNSAPADRGAGEGNAEQVQSVLQTEGPIQQEVAAFVDAVLEEEIRTASPIRLASFELSTALDAPDSSQISPEAAARARFELTVMPEGYSQAVIIGSTLDGEEARLVSQTCVVLPERLEGIKACGEIVLRVGSEDNGDASQAAYAMRTFTLRDLLAANALVGVNRAPDGTITGFWELGTTFNIPGSDVSVELAGGGFGPEEYGRMAATWAEVFENVDLSLEAFVNEGNQATGQLTLRRRF